VSLHISCLRIFCKLITRSDFSEALKREPNNESVKEELRKVVEQMAKQKIKVGITLIQAILVLYCLSSHIR